MAGKYYYNRGVNKRQEQSTVEPGFKEHARACPSGKKCWLILLSPVLLLLGACATGPAFDTHQIDLSITPRSAVAELAVTRGQPVLWGGIILNTSNLKSLTRIEVLAYPLNNNQMPQRNRDPLGRFILEYSGFLEPASYAEGRMVSVVGTLTRSETGKVGVSEYVYPVIEARNLYLWPREHEHGDRSNVHFGVGVGIGL